jgi:hypothetical protein
MIQIIEVLRWPVVAIIAVLIFRPALNNLIHRITKATKEGIEATPEPPSQQPTEKALVALNKAEATLGINIKDNITVSDGVTDEAHQGLTEFFKSFDNPLLLEQEGRIRDDLKAKMIESPDDKEKVLIKTLASTQLLLFAERILRIIWASQVELLHYINPRNDNGVDISEIKPFYEKAKNLYPSWYANYPIEGWLGFLLNYNLLTEKDSRYFITVAGREFLKYLIATGLAAPIHG